MPSHALLAPVKREDTTTRGSDDADVRATTAMAIVELLASGSAKPGSEDTKDAGAGSAASCSSWCASNASKCTLGAFPGLASLLPLKRPLWKTDAATAAPGGDAHKPTPVHIQPLPSIAQLSKLAISSVERMSPTGIDVVAANGSAMETASSPALTPIVPPRFSVVTSANSTPVTPAPSVNHSRKRQKDELDRLRVQVQELQRELEHVRGRIPKKPQMLALDGAGGGSDMHGLLPSSVTVWERIASHQKEQKNRSEMENMKLKAMVHEQVKISKALEKLVNKRCKNSQSLESKFAAKRLRVSEANEAQIYEMLSRDIGERYKHVDAALEELGMAAQKRELQEAQMILDTTNGPMMELKDATIFPFDVDAISDAAWRSMELESIGFNDNVGLVESVIVHSSEDTICMQTTAPIRHPRTNNEAELRIRAVIKRFVERHRVVVLWESVSEGLGKLPCLASASGAPSVEMRDRGLCLIEALPSAPGRHSTIIQLCSRLAPLVAGSEGGSSPHLPLQHMHGIVDSVAPCYRHIWGNRQQVMENILMENVVGLPRPGVVVGEPGSRSPKDEKMHLASHCGGASSSS
ncbi:hypothetical protein PybrP1_006438 [[Pythium] brassicae (nom. inval.)]|nr:hypothetical protein PybrP1_006438 [[Pythium] brassicae (nom. inval.)]